MPIDNLISISFTPAEIAQIDAALSSLETVFQGKVVQLTPKESQFYGKLGNETENWSNMVFTDAAVAPAGTIPGFVDTAGWNKDETTRSQLSPAATRLENIAQQVTDTNRMVGFDIFQTCRTVYNNVKYISSQNAPGAKALYQKWSIQFPGKKGKKTPPIP